MLSGAFMISLSFALLGTFGLTHAQSDYDSVQKMGTQEYWTEAMQPSATSSGGLAGVINDITGLVNFLTGSAWSLCEFAFNGIWIKGIIDQYTMGQEPYATFTNYGQAAFLMVYGVGAIGWLLTRNTT